MNALQAVLLVGWAVGGTLVVAVREPVRQLALAGVMGLISALAFFSLKAPDVALSQIVVSAVAVPLMVLFAVAKVRVQEEAADEEDE